MACNKRNLWVRSGIIQTIRQFFVDRNYLEIETPLLIKAPAPELHIDAVPIPEGFLQTSPELCMKRLLARGHERIFQICKCFRDKERGDMHLPEFTMLEWYRTGTEYMDLMRECESMLSCVFETNGVCRTIEYQGTSIDLKRPWQRIRVRDAFEHYSPVPVEDAIMEDRFDEIMVEYVEPEMSRLGPVFLYDYPSELAALSRLKSSDKGTAERFELYMGGLELANGFSELTNPREQRDRFEREEAKRRALGKKPYPVPEKFLGDLAFMPQAAGIALGVDRLVMLLCNASSIDEVVSFTLEET